MNHLNRKGFSLVEALVSLGVGTVFLAAVYNAWIYSTQAWKVESLNSELRYGIEMAMEKIKEDVRLSDGNSILFYPSDSAVYSAVSLPRATANASGFLSIDEDAGITWDRTVIYHVYDNDDAVELRRTVIDSYDSDAAARQSDLDSIAENGELDGAETSILFSGTAVDLEITPTNMTFDGYASTLRLSGNTSFGTIRMTSGTHTIRFRITGKNASSSGYRMGIDQITLTPSGGHQEAESLTVSADSGKTQNAENMTSYSENGTWNGNYQLEYQSSAVGDYIQFDTYYDQWRESNFASMSHSNSEIINDDPVISVLSREQQTLNPAWTANAQTSADQADNPSSVASKTIRCVISAGSISRAGQMVRFKFYASSSGALNIRAAYFGARLAGANAVLWNQLYFNNGTIGEGESDEEGAVGSTGPTTINIPAGEYAWSNWLETSIASPAASDYLVSFSIDTSGEEMYWDPGAGTNAYLEDGDTASAVWLEVDPGYTESSAIHALGEMATWISSGTATSQIYDTRAASPAYNTLTWDTNGSGSYAIKARSSDDSQMSGATDWSAISAHSSSPASLSIGSGRYVQFQATVTADSPYTTYPELDDVTIQWPGTTSVVQVSGYYTKRPNYGTFEVLVDGEEVVSALGIELNAVKEYQGRERSFSLKVDVNARNTGK